jgi:hypothetical protein
MISSKQALDASPEENGRYSTAERKSLYIVCKLLPEYKMWALYNEFIESRWTLIIYQMRPISLLNNQQNKKKIEKPNIILI